MTISARPREIAAKEARRRIQARPPDDWRQEALAYLDAMVASRVLLDDLHPQVAEKIIAWMQARSANYWRDFFRPAWEHATAVVQAASRLVLKGKVDNLRELVTSAVESDGLRMTIHAMQLTLTDLDVRLDETDTSTLQRFRDNWERVIIALAERVGIPGEQVTRERGRPRGHTGVPEARDLLETIRRVGLPDRYAANNGIELRTSRLLVKLGFATSRMPAPYDLCDDPPPLFGHPFFGPRVLRYRSRDDYDAALRKWPAPSSTTRARRPACPACAFTICGTRTRRCG